MTHDTKIIYNPKNPKHLPQVLSRNDPETPRSAVPRHYALAAPFLTLAMLASINSLADASAF